MRIVHVTDAYLPKQGGIEVQVHDLATRQILAGHDVRVLTCARGGPTDPEPIDPGRTRTDPTRSGTDPTRTDPMRIRTGGGDAGGDGSGDGSGEGAGGNAGQPPVTRVRSPWGRVRRTNAFVYDYYRREQPDVVHVHLSVLSPLAILGVRAASKAGIPVMMTLHSLWWWATPLYWIADKLLRWSRWRVHWTAVSELAARPLRAIVSSRGEVSVLPNGVEPAAWAVEPVPRDPSDVVVVSVMRLANRKRPRALLGVVRAARDRLPPDVRLRVLIVGDGPLTERLTRDIARLGLEDVVELLGRRERDQIRELYRRADLYIAPAILESFGIAALEARCAGVPVIARRQTGIADFIRDGEQGLLPSTDAGLADALVDLAADPALRSLMARRNREGAPETGWADVLQRCDLGYKQAHELVAGSARRVTAVR